MRMHFKEHGNQKSAICKLLYPAIQPFPPFLPQRHPSKKQLLTPLQTVMAFKCLEVKHACSNFFPVQSQREHSKMPKEQQNKTRKERKPLGEGQADFLKGRKLIQF